MNCTTCRYELSQCLDGRLASGRRAIVLQHIAICASCATFWADLQAAQQLTLQLPQIHVSEGFREQLWERIRAGEGTPDAVFREPVPWLTKVRYALTGAAAAAVALLAVKFASTGNLTSTGDLTSSDLTSSGQASREQLVAVGSHTAEAQPAWPYAVPIDESPLISSTQQLTFNLVAVETAKQLEQRYAAASFAIRLLDENPTNEPALRQVLENADELHAFGELLLDLHSRKRLFFTEAEVDADLRVTVSLLGQCLLGQNLLTQGQKPRHEQLQLDRTAVHSFVRPALLSTRLATVSRAISVKPPLDPHEEMDALKRLSTQRPSVFPKLFVFWGTDDEIGRDMSFIRTGSVFIMEDACGPSYAAPRSEVEARDGRLRILRSRSSGGGKQYQVEIIAEPAK